MFAIIVSRAIFLALFFFLFFFAGDEFEERRKGLKRVGNVLLLDYIRWNTVCSRVNVFPLFPELFIFFEETFSN